MFLLLYCDIVEYKDTVCDAAPLRHWEMEEKWKFVHDSICVYGYWSLVSSIQPQQ